MATKQKKNKGKNGKGIGLYLSNESLYYLIKAGFLNGRNHAVIERGRLTKFIDNLIKQKFAHGEYHVEFYKSRIGTLNDKKDIIDEEIQAIVRKVEDIRKREMKEGEPEQTLDIVV